LNLNASGTRSARLPAGAYIINALDNDRILFICHVPTNSSIRFDYARGCELSRNVGSADGAAVLDEIASGGDGRCPTPLPPSTRPPSTGDAGLAQAR
jgi:hypothetical protein